MIPDPASSLYERLMHPELRLGLGLGLPAGGNGSAAISLDFTTITTLDSRITFTRASSATRVNASGLIETVPSNVARLNYDPVTLAGLGLLVEDQRTNLMLYSEQLDNATWSKTRASISANAATSPDGTTNADKLVEDTSASDNHFAVQSITLAATTYTRTVYLKAAGRSWARLQVGGLASCYYDLTNGATGTVSGTGSPSASIANAGNGWWRCTLTFTGTAAATLFYILIATGNGVDVYTGDGSSGVLIWGDQVEAGAFATSYIPTTSAQVTRAADVPIITGTDFTALFNATEGSIYVAHDFPQANNAEPVCIDDGSNANSLEIYRSSSTRLNGFVQSGSVNQANIQSQALTGTRKKSVLVYKADAFSLCVDGGTPVADTSGSVPSGLTTLRIGHYRGPSLAINGHVRALSVWRRPLSTAEQQSQTAG